MHPGTHFVFIDHAMRPINGIVSNINQDGSIDLITLVQNPNVQKKLITGDWQSAVERRTHVHTFQSRVDFALATVNNRAQVEERDATDAELYDELVRLGMYGECCASPNDITFEKNEKVGVVVSEIGGCNDASAKLYTVPKPLAEVVPISGSALPEPSPNDPPPPPQPDDETAV